MVRDERIAEPDVYLRGDSLIHSAALTVEAFNRSFLGGIGPYIVALGLMLFAFSTALAWSYYGDRSMTFFGTKSIMPYRLVYVVGFFSGHCGHHPDLANRRHYHGGHDPAEPFGAYGDAPGNPSGNP